jgi:hypothetical protein
LGTTEHRRRGTGGDHERQMYPPCAGTQATGVEATLITWSMAGTAKAHPRKTVALAARMTATPRRHTGPDRNSKGRKQ